LNSDGAQLVQLDSVSLTYENDVTPPTLSISSPSNNSSTSYKIVTITGSATDSGSGISSLTINGVPISNPANFSETVQLGSGLNTFTFAATDNTGNSTTETLNITKLEPSITVTYPPNDVFLLLTRDWYIKITGSVNGNEVGIKSFRINGRTISNPGNFSMYVPVYKHWNTYTLVATDNADNTVEKIVKVYSTQGPPRPGFPPLLFTNIHSRLTKSYNNVFKVLSFGETSTISLDQSFTADRRPKFSGQTAPGAIIDIEIHSDPIKATIIAHDVGNWEYQVEEDLELGSHTMQIIIKSPENETIFEGNYNFIVENAKAASKSDGIQETQSASSMILIVLLSIALFGLIVIYFENKNRHKPLY